MQMNWPVVIIDAKRRFKAGLERKAYWTRMMAYQLFVESYDEACVAYDQAARESEEKDT